MRFQTTLAATSLTVLGVLCGNTDLVAQTAPSQPLQQPTPHYILGVPLPKFELRGRLLKPTLRVYFPDDPGGFYKNQKDILKKSITTEDRRTHPQINVHDLIRSPIPADSLWHDTVPRLNLG